MTCATERSACAVSDGPLLGPAVAHDARERVERLHTFILAVPISRFQGWRTFRRDNEPENMKDLYAGSSPQLHFHVSARRKADGRRPRKRRSTRASDEPLP